jgi:hydroxymethylpyrimidine/phosphomethylpyrimidine kinase
MSVPRATVISSALSIAGSDPSGGAGIQADLKTFSALGVYGMAVLTALTAQSTQGVTGVVAVDPDFVTIQLDTLLADITPGAVKIGMLADAGIADAVGAVLDRHPALPVVLDPVMVATSGDRLLDEDAMAAVTALLPRADLVTPNLGEAAVLTGTEVADGIDTMRAQAETLRDRLGARRVLLKGGHLDGPASDLYLDDAGPQVITSRRIDTPNTHGTGCTLSSAVAANIAGGLTWPEAVRAAKTWLTSALEHADSLGIGNGHGPVHHFWRIWRPSK